MSIRNRVANLSGTPYIFALRSMKWVPDRQLNSSFWSQKIEALTLFRICSHSDLSDCAEPKSYSKPAESLELCWWNASGNERDYGNHRLCVASILKIECLEARLHIISLSQLNLVELVAPRTYRPTTNLLWYTESSQSDRIVSKEGSRVFTSW
jgi:hypothetical protein